MRRQWAFEKEVTAALLLVAACVVLALTATGGDLTRRAMVAVAGALAPFERPAVFVMQRVENFRRWTVSRRALLLELAELRAENLKLRLRSGAETAEQMKSFVRAPNRYPIIYRDPRVWWESVRIATGGERFEPGTAVFDGSDLAGVVTAQEDGSAWVRLITSAHFYVPVVVETTREIGALAGDGDGGVWLKYLPADADYPAGTKIYTVLGSRLSAGLPVGELTGEKRTPIPGLTEYRVKTGADLYRLQYLHLGGGTQ